MLEEILEESVKEMVLCGWSGQGDFFEVPLVFGLSNEHEGYKRNFILFHEF